MRCLPQDLGIIVRASQKNTAWVGRPLRRLGLTVVGGMLQHGHSVSSKHNLQNVSGQSGSPVGVSPPVGAAVTCGPHVRPLTAQLGSVGIASLSIVQLTCARSTGARECARGPHRYGSMSDEHPARRTQHVSAAWRLIEPSLHSC